MCWMYVSVCVCFSTSTTFIFQECAKEGSRKKSNCLDFLLKLAVGKVKRISSSNFKL